MESSFALQENVLNRERWATRDELRLAIITWIEKAYHRRRQQERLARITPVEFGTVFAPSTWTSRRGSKSRPMPGQSHIPFPGNCEKLLRRSTSPNCGFRAVQATPRSMPTPHSLRPGSSAL